MNEIGTVISTFEGTPSSREFSFVIKEDFDKIPIRKGQFVQIQMNDGILVARVAEIMKTNRYFSRAESVREFERSGRPLVEMFPVERWEYLVANATSLGIFSDGRQMRVSFPPSPGDKVCKIDEKILHDFLGLDKQGGLEVGSVEFHDISSKLNLTKLFQKHVSILAQSGAGKSHCVSVLIEELMDRSQDLGKPAVIVIDPHGEYGGFSEDKKYGEKTKVFEKKSLKIATNDLSSYQISEFQPFMSHAERRDLTKIINELRKQKIPYDMQELISAIEMSDIKPNIKGPMVSWLADLNSIDLFSNIDSPSLEELARMDQLSVVDLSDFIHLKEKQIIVTHLARRLFEARRSGRIPPFILIVEEAHQFIPEQTESSRAISKNILETIAREGRKFHASLVLVSQRPIQLSTTALSQCNSSIILRISNPYDIKHIAESIEGVTSDIVNILPGLKVGEAIITGEVVNYPILVQVRERKSKKSEKGIKLEDALIKFGNKVSQNKKDLEGF